MIDPTTILVDVQKLSEVRCSVPIVCRLKYATEKNFLGRRVNGYDEKVNVCLMTKEAAQALFEVQNHLNQQGLGLKIYDAYRPERAVNDFLSWSTQPVTSEYERIRKTKHYPNVEKSELFSLGYVAVDSSHCYGHTVDLTLIKTSGEKLEMGTRFDYMDKLSHTSATAQEIGNEAYANRQLLTSAMQAHGFIPYKYEWWHFSYKHQEVKEPMDIPITEKLSGLNVEKREV